MNTDNMTISGETIDYGPCAFMEVYEPATVFSSIDQGGRYAYGNQPLIAQWDLARFAETLLPLLADDQDAAVETAVASLTRFRQRYDATYGSGIRAKLGLPAGLDAEVATGLADDWLEILHGNHVDWTSGFRALSAAAHGDGEPLRGLVLDLAAVDDWLARWRALEPDAAGMERTNPLYIPRNHLVEEALDAATASDLAPFERLVDVVRHPFEQRPGWERYAVPAPDDFGHYVTYCGT
jgi:uncharacterized protein YdiU (UPF0061 family)